MPFVKRVTVKDLEQVMDLGAWLRTSDQVRKKHRLGDAWAEGRTDCAFRINEVVAVQHSFRDDDWNFEWDQPSNSHLIRPKDMAAEENHKSGQDFGTHLDLQLEHMTQEVLGQTPWETTVDRFQTCENRAGEADLTIRYSTGETTVKEVTVTDKVAVELEAEFEVFGAVIKVSSTCEDSKAWADSTTQGAREEGTIIVPAGKYVELHAVKRECEKRYRVRVPVVMKGWVGLATTEDRNNWNTILPLTDPDDLDAGKGMSFVSKDRVTRWLSLEMNVTSTEIVEVISYADPTETSVTEAKVHEKLSAAAKEEQVGPLA